MAEEHQTIADQIYESLRESIIRYELPPGEFLREQQIALVHGASRTPVRESLRRLEQAGLVVRAGRSGYRVRRFDIRQMDQLYDVRIALEELAVRSAVECLTDEVATELRRIWRSFPATGDPSEALDADEAFHEGLAAASGNKVLLEFLKVVNERIHIIRRIDFTSPERWAATAKEHGEILDMLEARDGDAASDCLREHILTSKTVCARLTVEGLAQIYLPAT